MRKMGEDVEGMTEIISSYSSPAGSEKAKRTRNNERRRKKPEDESGTAGDVGRGRGRPGRLGWCNATVAWCSPTKKEQDEIHELHPSL